VLDDHINLEHHHQGHQLTVMPASKREKKGRVGSENRHPLVSYYFFGLNDSLFVTTSKKYKQ
jgi:hypothetical protein